MNRAPAARDPWWDDHIKQCGGAFAKIKEPPAMPSKKIKDRPTAHLEQASTSKAKKARVLTIQDAFNTEKSKLGSKSDSKTKNKMPVEEIVISDDDVSVRSWPLQTCPVCGVFESAHADSLAQHVEICLDAEPRTAQCRCPACGAAMDEALINIHLDEACPGARSLN